MNYYCTAVYKFGAPSYVRELTLAEATAMFDACKEHNAIAFCQYGVVGAVEALGSWPERKPRCIREQAGGAPCT